MLACGFILLVLSFGKKTTVDIISEKAILVWDSLGALGFLVIALIGCSGGFFFYNFLMKGTPLKLISGGTLMWSNIAIGIKVSACLLAVFIALAIFRMEHDK